MAEESHEFLTLLLLMVSWIVISQELGRLITENRYLIETVSLLLIFGLVYEAWTSMEGEKSMIQEAASTADMFGRSGAQIALIIAVTSMVVSSMFMRQWVEATFGPLAAVQLLAIVGILSRAFVNAHSGEDVLEVVDGTRSTRVVYVAGFLAILLSQYLKGAYPPHTVQHNTTVILLSTGPPAFYYLIVPDDRDLKSLWQRLAEET